MSSVILTVVLPNCMSSSCNVKLCFYGQVESETSYVRVGGTSIGGGTFWGLGMLLTKAKVRLPVHSEWLVIDRQVVSIFLFIIEISYLLDRDVFIDFDLKTIS